jgi:hypothetical protein
VLAVLYQTRGTLQGKMGIETKHTFCVTFCILFHFDTLSGCKDKIRRHYFPNTLYTLFISFEENLVQDISAKMFLTDCEFHENWHNEGHTLPSDLNEFLSVLSTRISQLEKNSA